MSTKPVVKNPAPADNGDGKSTAPKKNIFMRVYDKGQKIRLKIESTKGGKAVVKIGKYALYGLGLYESFKFGQRSIKPTTVYISEGVQEEEEPAEETPVDETIPEMEEEQEHD